MKHKFKYDTHVGPWYRPGGILIVMGVKIGEEPCELSQIISDTELNNADFDIIEFHIHRMEAVIDRKISRS